MQVLGILLQENSFHVLGNRVVVSTSVKLVNVGGE